MAEGTSRRIWRAASVAVAILLVFDGFYFDYSDRFLKSGMGVAVLALAFVVPRAAVIGVTVVLLVGSILSICLRVAGGGVPDAVWAKIEPGMERATVVALAGTPQLIVPSRNDLSSLRTGWAKPSPYRYRHQGPIEVYYGGDFAIWVFYENGRVVDAYVGGS